MDDQWNDPSFVLQEISNVLNYLRTKIPENTKGYDEAIKKLEIMRGLFGRIDEFVPFSNVLIEEFKKLSRDRIEAIKIKSNKCTERLDLEVLFGNLCDSLDKNVFISCIQKQIGKGVDTFSELPDDIKQFITIGKQLKDNEMTSKIVADLKSLKNKGVKGDKSAVSNYAIIIGPSLMGKPQAAFTLSHVLNVIYSDLMKAIFEKNDVTPRFNSPYKQFSKLLVYTLNFDTIALLKAISMDGLADLEVFRSGFYTLGLLYLLIRNHALKLSQSVGDRFLELINIQKTMIPAITITEFKRQMKELNLNLDNHLIFIDEIDLEILQE